VSGKSRILRSEGGQRHLELEPQKLMNTFACLMINIASNIARILRFRAKSPDKRMAAAPAFQLSSELAVPA